MTLLAQTPSLRARQASLRTCARSERLKCTPAIVWILPSPARARRACPLPGQRLSIFSILRPERAKKLSIGVHGFAENRENRQPLDRERDLEKQGEGKRSSQTPGFVSFFSAKITDSALRG